MLSLGLALPRSCSSRRRAEPGGFARAMLTTVVWFWRYYQGVVERGWPVYWLTLASSCFLFKFSLNLVFLFSVAIEYIEKNHCRHRRCHEDLECARVIESG